MAYENKVISRGPANRYAEYSDATYEYWCEADIGSALTDAVWLVARRTILDGSLMYASTTGPAAYDNRADDLATVTALTYNNGVA